MINNSRFLNYFYVFIFFSTSFIFSEEIKTIKGQDYLEVSDEELHDISSFNIPKLKTQIIKQGNDVFVRTHNNDYILYEEYMVRLYPESKKYKNMLFSKIVDMNKRLENIKSVKSEVEKTNEEKNLGLLRVLGCLVPNALEYWVLVKDKKKITTIMNSIKQALNNELKATYVINGLGEEFHKEIYSKDEKEKRIISNCLKRQNLFKNSKKVLDIEYVDLNFEGKVLKFVKMPVTTITAVGEVFSNGFSEEKIDPNKKIKDIIGFSILVLSKE